MPDINYTYVSEELKEHMQTMVDEHFRNTYQALKTQFDKWLQTDNENEWLVYNAKISISKLANSDYRTIKTLEGKLSWVGDQFDKQSNELGHNVHKAHKMEIPQSQYEKFMRLKNNYRKNQKKK